MASKSSQIVSAERTALVLQGVVAILFGIAAVFWPGLTTVTLVYLFAAFLLVDGIIALIWGLTKLGMPLKGILIILLGLLELGIGLFLVRNPEVAFATLILILGFALIVRGVFAFAHAFTGSDSSTGKTMHAILGVLGVVVGIFILAQPVAGGLAFIWVLGLYALIAGPVMIAMSSELAKAKR
ncbi:MAG: HdeD family acid-resistance protein [Candidatus Saccharimonadales bacterium]